MNCHLTLAALTFLGITISGCKKESAASPPVTSLEITVQNSLGSNAASASVILYATETDWKNSTNHVRASFTDVNGVVKFDSLQAIQYYWTASLECENNSNTTHSTSATLVANTVNPATSGLRETGNLRFSNSSANPYSVYVDGALVLVLAGKSSGEMANLETGPYSIRVRQNSGYTIYPTDKTYAGVLACGSSLTVVFPN